MNQSHSCCVHLMAVLHRCVRYFIEASMDVCVRACVCKVIEVVVRLLLMGVCVGGQ